MPPVVHTYLENLGNALKPQNLPANVSFFVWNSPDQQRNPQVELLRSSTAALGHSPVADRGNKPTVWDFGIRCWPWLSALSLLRTDPWSSLGLTKQPLH